MKLFTLISSLFVFIGIATAQDATPTLGYDVKDCYPYGYSDVESTFDQIWPWDLGSSRRHGPPFCGKTTVANITFSNVNGNVQWGFLLRSVSVPSTVELSLKYDTGVGFYSPVTITGVTVFTNYKGNSQQLPYLGSFNGGSLDVTLLNLNLQWDEALIFVIDGTANGNEDGLNFASLDGEFKLLVRGATELFTIASNPEAGESPNPFLGELLESAVEQSSETSSETSSSLVPTITGSYVDGNPQWEVNVPGELGPWGHIGFAASASAGFTFTQAKYVVDGETYPVNSTTISNVIFDTEEYSEDGLVASFLGRAVSGDSFTITLLVAIEVPDVTEVRRLGKRDTIYFELTDTVTATSSSSADSTTCSNASTPTTTGSSVPTTGGPSVITKTESEQSSTLITITSCSDNKCSETPVTTGVTVITTTAHGTVTTYTTYCPLTIETETGYTGTAKPTGTTPTIAPGNVTLSTVSTKEGPSSSHAITTFEGSGNRVSFASFTFLLGLLFI